MPAYSASRSADVLNTLLSDYSGALMVDGYEGYQGVCVERNLTRLGCWAHARRKFVEAQRNQPKGKSGKADMGLSFIQKLWHRNDELDLLKKAERFFVRKK